MNRWIRSFKNPLLRVIIRFSIILGILFMLFISSAFLYFSTTGPPPLQLPVNSTYYASNERVISKSNEPGITREWVPLSDISKELIDATIAIEDKRFYEHFGFDLRRIIGATFANWKAGSRVEGASTITMQYARNMYLSHEKTWSRKIKETLYALRLEFHYSKDTILEGYLNTIYYGHGTYGVEAAANYYFQKRARDLTLSEASLMAGIPKGPSYYSPELDFSNAKRRQEVILEAMSQNGYISKQEQRQAKAEQITTLVNQDRLNSSVAPYFLDAVKEALIHEVGLHPSTVETGGLHVYTTLDLDMQQKAEAWVENSLTGNPNLQAALVTIDPKTGAVKALVGGRDYTESSFNRAIKAKRAPGSTFKTFLYYAALENGFSPSTLLLSEPTTFQYDDGNEMYKPKNFGDLYAHDFITLAQAIALSDNTYAVKTHLLIGQDKLVKTAKQFGITSSLPEVPSLALGTAPVSVLEMAHAYAALANEGKQMNVHFIKKVVDSSGKVIYENKNEGKQVLDRDLAFVTTSLLAGMFDENLNSYTRVTGASISHLLRRPVAGKTGTTSTDSWMVGFTPELVTAIWNGYDKDKELHPINDTVHAKNIWANYMEDVSKERPVANFKRTEGVTGVRIDPQTGKVATASCELTRYVYYITGTEPEERCEHEGDSPESSEEHAPEERSKWWEILFQLFN